MKNHPRIAILGGGSWATAIVKILSDNIVEKDVYWWLRDAQSVQHLQEYRHNPNYLSAVEIKIDKNKISADIKEIVAQADFILLNVPAAFLKQTLSSIGPEHLAGKKIISAIKGIVPEENLIIADYLHQHKKVALEDILVIGGPCHAEEVALEKLSYLTLAGINQHLVADFAKLMRTRYIKVNLSDDIFGTEYAAVLKNIYAMASGICHGLGYGDNFQAVLISNAIREMKRFVDTVHPINRDINESAYLGDLLVTAYSQFSRNRTFGHMIGKGYSVSSAQMEMNMIAEGYYALNCIHGMNEKYAVFMPICDMAYRVLYQKATPSIEVAKLVELLD